jgi:uncharacterized protein YukE
MNIPKKEIEVQAKDIQKLKEQIENLDQKFKDQINKLDKTLNENFNKLDQKFTDQIAILNQIVRDRVEEFDQEMKTLTENIDDQSKDTNNKLKNLKEELKIFQQNLEDQINVQKEINTDLIQEFNKQFTTDKRNIAEELEKIKGEQDVLKISYTVNEKQLLEKIQTIIASEIKNVCSDKEREILMNIWLKELKDIIADFEKLKKMNPKEFNLKIEEISNTIELFKQKILK